MQRSAKSNDEIHDSDLVLSPLHGSISKTTARAALTMMEVKSIVAASFGENGKRCYKVQWKESWVYDDHLYDCDSLVRQFWSKQTESVNVGSKRLHNEDVRVNGKNEIIAVVQSAESNEISQQIDKELNTVHDENLKCNNEILPNDDGDSSHRESKQRKKNPLSCHLCNKDFEMVSAIRRHYAEEHPGMKPFACESCGKRFDRRENLNRHIRIHTGDKKYICEHCGKGYTDPSGLKKHCISKHTKLKCDICCVNSFKTKEALNKHIESHLQNSGICTYANPDEDDLFTKLHHKAEYQVKPLDDSQCKLIQGLTSTKQSSEVSIQSVFTDPKVLQVQLLNVSSSTVEDIRNCDIVS